jgi:hypothetical protein
MAEIFSPKLICDGQTDQTLFERFQLRQPLLGPGEI